MNPHATLLAIVPYPFLPPRKGGEWCTFYTCHHLAERLPMHLVAPPQPDPAYPAAFRLETSLLPGKGRYLWPGTLWRIYQAGLRTKADGLLLHQPFLGFWAYIASQMLGRPLSVYIHNLEYARFRSMGKPWWPLLLAWEGWLYRRAAGLLFISEEERQEALRQWGLDPAKCLLLPYGVKQASAPPDARLEARQRLGLPADRPIFLFYGALDYAPNALAINALAEGIVPAWEKQQYPEALWLIGGGGLSRSRQEWLEGHPQLRCLGFVDDLDGLIQAADVVLNPVLQGGGVTTKVMEALGGGKTVVSTESGAAGIDRSATGSKLRVVPDGDWEAFALALQEALPGAGAPLPEAFYRRYHWPQLVAEAASYLEGLR